MLGAALRQASLPPQWSRSLHLFAHLKIGRFLLAVTLALVLPVGTVGLGMRAWPGIGKGMAAESTPPPPPTYVPTTIPGPPPPPTPIPIATSTPSVTSTASPTASPSPTATAKPAAAFFSLDAARVSRVGNPGNLQGLAEVKRGSKVWLMMYYTVGALPRNLTRTTVYTVRYGKRTVYQVTYKSAEKAADHGRFSRFTVYAVPSTLPYGAYTYRATLSLAGQRRSKSWKFRIGRHARIAVQSGRQ